ncbi:unnamed protein product [Macrosiphum euphorbiae]|uniref:Uncharacterized protein n=1 Tax=Macrosiphum euphorbiae TaxID=13131 RepID=A0AAV0XU18_9HEMI|nr:unnamed protein product [Macrosiphum euphorbiae]
MLPAVPSHYCRSSTSKQYISSDFNSLNHVYRFYVEHCNMKNISPVSNAVFKNKWNTEYNICIHAPKKDKCAFCEGYKNKDTKTDEDTLHYVLRVDLGSHVSSRMWLLKVPSLKYGVKQKL